MTIKRTLDMSLLISLMRGEMVVLCGTDTEPSIELTLDEEEVQSIGKDSGSACDIIDEWWDL